MYRFALSSIKKIEYLDPVSSIQYLISVRVVHHRFGLSTKSCPRLNGIFTIAIVIDEDQENLAGLNDYLGRTYEVFTAPDGMEG